VAAVGGRATFFFLYVFSFFIFHFFVYLSSIFCVLSLFFSRSCLCFCPLSPSFPLCFFIFFFCVFFSSLLFILFFWFCHPIHLLMRGVFIRGRGERATLSNHAEGVGWQGGYYVVASGLPARLVPSFFSSQW
jgi:signal transduction histidine kinase